MSNKEQAWNLLCIHIGALLTPALDEGRGSMMIAFHDVITPIHECMHFTEEKTRLLGLGL
jgi:hypothetical protein